MKIKPMLLKPEQARELKWFCQNVTGTRQEFYAALGGVQSFQDRIDRLQKTADMILKYCEANGINMVGESPTPSRGER